MTNTGNRLGDEVVQLYIRQDLTSRVRPVLSLRGFQRVSLKPGETRELSFPLSYEDYKFWKDGTWIFEPGELKVLLGSSSVDLFLKGSVQIK